MMGRNFDPAMFDNPEVRFAIAGQVVNEHLLTGKARDEKFRVSDAQLRQFIASIPAFQDDGKFSPERYELVPGRAEHDQAARSRTTCAATC